MRNHLKFDQRKYASFVYIGGWKHPPNLDAAKWLRYKIWPIIKESLLEARVDLCGAYPNHQAEKFRDPKLNFNIHGFIESLRVLEKSKVLVAPLRYGAGLIGKIADSWSYGTPVVTTPIRIEGMVIDNNSSSWGGLVASDAESFASYSIKLCTNKKLWGKCQKNGVILLSNLFPHDANMKHIWFHLVQGFNNLQALLEKNVTGELLWHQNARSTEYFSRWIELKEKAKFYRAGLITASILFGTGLMMKIIPSIPPLKDNRDRLGRSY